MLVEIIASSPDDCIAIEAAGAHRVELCSALVLGGLTPSIGTIAECKKRCGLPIMAMIRPRAAGMCYSESEIASMERDIDAALDAGADGVVFGVLREDGTLDAARMSLLARRAEGAQVVCHRAFDVTPNAFEALETLIDMGFTRVLSSGQAASAPLGLPLLGRLLEAARGRIEILPGAGIDASNAAEFRHFGQIHLAAFGLTQDPSGAGNPSVQFSGSVPPPEGSYDSVDTDAVRAVVTAV
ncbi:MAG: copper homeostasis protein CutC [Fimbriimonadales bacterium]